MPRKRARSSSASGRESDDEEVVIPTRDAEYYDEEGDCVVRIENVLFKVRHTVILLTLVYIGSSFTAFI